VPCGSGDFISMNDVDLAKCLHAARKTMIAIHERDSEALRRKPRPDELIASVKLWAEKLLDVATINPGPGKLRSSSDFNRKGRPAIYAEEISAAESILTIIAELKSPMAIMVAFRKAFPTEFEKVKCALPCIRTLIGKNGIDVYYFYRRQGKDIKPAWERPLPSDPTSAEFMQAYKQAERDFEARHAERRIESAESYERALAA
jgi:hypothetical protein